MSYKTILVHLEHGKQAEQLLNAAVRMAGKYDAHLIATYVIHPIEPFVGITGELSVYRELVDVFARQQSEIADEIKEVFEKKTKAQGLVAEWRYVDRTVDPVSTTVSEMSRSVDLLMISSVINDPPRKVVQYGVGPVVTTSSCPVLVVPERYEDKSLGDYVLIAWDGSREASRAVFGSLPVLHRAKTVWLHRIDSTDESKNHTDDATRNLADALARHDIELELSSSQCSARKVGEELLRVVDMHGADCLVMGAYGHSRLRSLVLGGATHHVLDNSLVPLLLAH